MNPLDYISKSLGDKYEAFINNSVAPVIDGFALLAIMTAIFMNILGLPKAGEIAWTIFAIWLTLKIVGMAAGLPLAIFLIVFIALIRFFFR